MIVKVRDNIFMDIIKLLSQVSLNEKCTDAFFFLLGKKIDSIK